MLASHSKSPSLSLKPLVAVIKAPPDTVCVALLRYASNPNIVQSTQLGSGRLDDLKWTAHRLEQQHVVSYTLKEGVLESLQLRFVGEPDGEGSTALLVTCDYGLRSGRLRGALERWQAQRSAVMIRDGVIAALQVMISEQIVEPTQTMRAAERLQVRAGAHLYVGGRDWRAEVLDVSETGLAIAIFPALGEEAAEAATFLLSTATGEVELQQPGGRLRAEVQVRRATPQRGGKQVGVGLQVMQPDAILPLFRKAAARAKLESQGY